MLPLWEATKTRPWGSSGSAKAALAVSMRPLRGLTRPMLLGPSTRVPLLRARSPRRFSRAVPSAPDSEKPPASTVTTFTPRRTHSSTVGSTLSVGVRTKTWSGTSGRSDSEGQACASCTVGRRGLMGYTVPAKPERCM